MLEHLDLVEPIARKMRRRLPDSFELQDLVQEGILGLLAAARTYRAGAGASKRTWAWRKITHAIQQAVQGKAYSYATGRAPLEIVEREAAPVPEPEKPENPVMLAAMAELSPLQHQLIHLVYYQNQTLYALRTTKELGISSRKLKEQHDAALESLRPFLKQAA